MPRRRVFVEKKPGFDIEARRLKADIAAFLGPRYPALGRLRSLRILNRYDLEGDEPGQTLTDGQFEKAVRLVFSEPPCDRVYDRLGPGSGFDAAVCFGVEYLPGQYDQRADSAAQCVELVTGIKPAVRCAKFYILQTGEDGGANDSGGTALDEAALGAVQDYLVNPVDSRLVPEGE